MCTISLCNYIKQEQTEETYRVATASSTFSVMSQLRSRWSPNYLYLLQTKLLSSLKVNDTSFLSIILVTGDATKRNHDNIQHENAIYASQDIKIILYFFLAIYIVVSEYTYPTYHRTRTHLKPYHAQSFFDQLTKYRVRMRSQIVPKQSPKPTG